PRGIKLDERDDSEAGVPSGGRPRMASLFLVAFPAEAGPFVLLYLVWPAYWAWACWFVATEKARNPGWGWAGFFVGPFAFIPLAAAPDLTEYEDPRTSSYERLGTRLKSQRGKKTDGVAVDEDGG